MKRKEHQTILGKTGASFSDCGLYRYTLWRHWGPGDYLNYLMLNPSTADELTNDATIERCQRRAKMLGYGGLIVTNLFAFRATQPKDMKAAADPVGPENDQAIRESASQCKHVICAWGQHGRFKGRDAAVLKVLRDFCPWKLHALKLSKDGTPWHPLYVSYEAELIGL